MARIKKMEVYPVAGKDCMELNLSGAHAPYFTRNIVVLYDENGETGVGEVSGFQRRRRCQRKSDIRSSYRGSCDHSD